MPESGKAPKVTLIMPAYNAAAYISASVRSVLDQSFRDWELIVVNDGSGDDTGRILATLSDGDARLRPMTVENGGPALARNRGLAAVKPGTEYIMFLDADDALAPDALEYALSGAEDGAELVIFGFSILGADGSRRDYSEPEKLLSRSEFGARFAGLYKANLLNQVWGKLYKAELLLDNGILFQDCRWGEDRLFIFDCLAHMQLVRILPKCKYRYIMHRGESLITRFYDRKFSICLEIDRQAEALCASFGVDEQADFRYMFAKSVFSCLTNLFSASCLLSKEEKRAVAEGIIRDERVLRRCRNVSGGLAPKLLCAVLRSGSIGLNLFVFRLVALAGRAAPRLFTALKHRK